MSAAGPMRDMDRLHARRRHARRRRTAVRQDLLLGLVAALVLLLASPGLAIAFVVALVLLLLIFASIMIERRTLRRRAHARGKSARGRTRPSDRR
jgi:hypothetical protein